MVVCHPLMINPPPMVVVIVICLVLEIDHVYRTYSEATKYFVFIWPYLIETETLNSLSIMCRCLNKILMLTESMEIL